MQAVVALFEGPLAGVKFADIDAVGLSELAAEVGRFAADVEQQEAKLGELRQGLAQRQEALALLAQQALAYARIYAEGDDELSAKLNEISLPRAGKPRKATASKAPTAGSATTAEQRGQEAVVEEQSVDSSDANADATTSEAAAGESDEPLKTKPSYARPKVKRRLGRAAPQGDSV